ncbi:MAG: hypothetical protein GY791_14890 [Alphaproteobacteria bacterium]|nr:hypothetical protein [Alphaproteobacteria bacterium]
MSVGAGVDPFEKHGADDIAAFEKVARAWSKGAKLLTDDLVQMNLALINGEIDSCRTGGTYTASPARLDGATNICGIMPDGGPMNGKGGISWVEDTSAVDNAQVSPLAEDFLESDTEDCEDDLCDEPELFIMPEHGEDQTAPLNPFVGRQPVALDDRLYCPTPH